MQFGSVFRMKPKPGQKQAAIDQLKGRQPSDMPGFVVAHVFDCGDELWGAAVFEDEKTYRDNAGRPEQDAQYQQLRALLEADPEWHDGAVTTVQR